MPGTFSHPAAVLPFRRLTPQLLDFPALVIGSMTPDIGYFIDRFDLANFAHTLRGSFIACLPTGLLMLLTFYLFARPICYALPAPHRQALLPRCPVLPANLLRWAIIFVSLLLGAWTHIFWDAFTHEHGWFVDRIPRLQQAVMHIGSTTIQGYLFLQELSTIVGFLILAIAYWSWLHREPPSSPAEVGNETWRYIFWVVIIVLTFGIGLPAAVRYAMSTSLHGFLFFRAIVFRAALYCSGIAVPSMLLGATVIYACRAVPETTPEQTSDPTQS